LSKSDFEHSSLGVRFKVEQVTRDVWRTSPTVGVGLRYFQSGEFGFAAQAANNDVDNELAESGVIGLCGYVVLQGTAIAVAVRRRKGNPLAVAAAGVVAGALLHGMVDIYWTSGTVTVAFLILGLGLAQDTDELELPPLIESRAAVAG
jgi:O-antigen ligase